MKTCDARTLSRWRKWLADHHKTEPEVWLIFYKQHTGKRSIAYLDAVDEALCYGWIDGLVKRLDEDRYARRFTPRRRVSKWSNINITRYAALEKAGRLKAAGKTRSPETGGRYPTQPAVPSTMPADLSRAIKATPAAWAFFQTLTATQQRYHWGWIHIAKQEETKARRLSEVIHLLAKKQKLGLK